MRAMVYIVVDWIGLQSMDRRKKRICESVGKKITNKKKDDTSFQIYVQ